MNLRNILQNTKNIIDERRNVLFVLIIMGVVLLCTFINSHVNALREKSVFYQIAQTMNQELPMQLGSLATLEKVVFKNDTLAFCGSFSPEIQTYMDYSLLHDFYQKNASDISDIMCTAFVVDNSKKQMFTELAQLMNKTGVTLSHKIYLKNDLLYEFNLSGNDILEYITSDNLSAAQNIVYLLKSQLDIADISTSPNVIAAVTLAFDGLYIKDIYVSDEQPHKIIIEAFPNQVLEDIISLHPYDPFLIKHQITEFLNSNTDFLMVKKIIKSSGIDTSLLIDISDTNCVKKNIEISIH